MPGEDVTTEISRREGHPTGLSSLRSGDTSNQEVTGGYVNFNIAGIQNVIYIKEYACTKLQIFYSFLGAILEYDGNNQPKNKSEIYEKLSRINKDLSFFFNDIKDNDVFRSLFKKVDKTILVRLAYDLLNDVHAQGKAKSDLLHYLRQFELIYDATHKI
ncbi:hypothetical protein HMI55_004413, partial [Coelomomyces lativittatus]